MDLSKLIEFGAVGAFAMYALFNNREWRLYLSERNGKLEKSLDKIDATMNRIHDEHKQFFSNNR